MPGSGLIESALLLPGLLLSDRRPLDPDTALVVQAGEYAQHRLSAAPVGPGVRAFAEIVPSDRIGPSAPVAPRENNLANRVGKPPVNQHALDNFFAVQADALLSAFAPDVEPHTRLFARSSLDNVGAGSSSEQPLLLRADAPQATPSKGAAAAPAAAKLVSPDTDLAALKSVPPGKAPPGPIPFAVGPYVGLHVGANIPLNADNENGSSVTDGVAQTRDFEVNPIAGETDLVQAGLQFPQNAIGTVTLIVAKHGRAM